MENVSKEQMIELLGSRIMKVATKGLESYNEILDGEDMNTNDAVYVTVTSIMSYMTGYSNAVLGPEKTAGILDELSELLVTEAN